MPSKIPPISTDGPLKVPDVRKPKGSFTRHTTIKKAGKKLEPKIFEPKANVHALPGLMSEWSVEHPEKTPEEFLKLKGYKPGECKKFFKMADIEHWNQRKKELTDAVLLRSVDRNIALIASMQEVFLKTANLGMVRGLEMLTKYSVNPSPEFVEVDFPGKTKKIVQKKQLKSSDIANIMLALKSAMDVVRKGMGLDDESGGLTEILTELKEAFSQGGANIHLNQININNSTNISEHDQKQMEGSSFQELRAMRQFRDLIDAVEGETEAPIEIEAHESNGRDAPNGGDGVEGD